MITFQDYERFLAKGGKVIDFVYNVIKEHKNSEDYKIAYTADQYNRRRNVTISNYQKIGFIIIIIFEIKTKLTGRNH